jgi:hypothetical protein
MKIIGSNGSSLTITILGYEFPDLHDAPYDSNFLRIQVDVIAPQGSWTATDHCLLTYEVSEIAAWFDEIAAGNKVRAQLGFIEPMLELRLIKEPEKDLLRIYFEGFLRPSWAGSRSIGQMDLWVEFDLKEIDLPAIAQKLRLELQSYPQRAEK